MKNTATLSHDQSQKSLLFFTTCIISGAFALIMLMTGGDAELIAKAIR